MKTIALIVTFAVFAIHLTAQPLKGEWFRSNSVVLAFAENGFITENNNGTVTLGTFIYDKDEQSISITWAGKPNFTYIIDNLTDTILVISAADGTYYEYYKSLSLAKTNEKLDLENANPSLPKTHDNTQRMIRCTTCNGLGRVHWYDEVAPHTQQTRRV